MDNKETGKIGENYAIEIYQKSGFKILIRNFFNHTGKIFGEIDFVAKKGRDLRFVEVKTRASYRFGSGLESITNLKKRKILKAAQFFIVNFAELGNCQMHFDLAEVIINPIDKMPESIKIYSDVIDDYAS